VATVLANGQSLSLFGDNLFVDLDLSRRNVPVGTTLGVGTAVLRVSAKTHDPCRKFSARFGAAAFELTNSEQGLGAGLRGVYLEVVRAGAASPGDVVEILQRA
ncbi:MAG: MOSC domain-containing protein, partial [Myxococcota bacterium]|nr:MOSC domain-containing protein [Myxococcota bacterium]